MNDDSKERNNEKMVSWFNGISTFVGYLMTMPKPFLLKNSSGTF